MKRLILGGKRLALCLLALVMTLLPCAEAAAAGGGGGGGTVPLGPTYYSRPSDQTMARAYDAGLLRYIQPQSAYTSFVEASSGGLTRLEAAELLAAFCDLRLLYGETGHTDTGNLTATQKAVIKAVSIESLMAGYADMSFQPDGILTRAAGCKLLCDALFGLRSAQNFGMVPDEWYKVKTPPFPDVPAGSTFAKYITLCKEYSIIPTDGYFYPADTLSKKVMIEWMLAAVEVRDSQPDYLFAFPPKGVSGQEKIPVTSGNVGNITELAVFVKTKQPRNAYFAAAFYEGKQFKGMGMIPETLDSTSQVVYIPLGARLSSSTTVKLFALDDAMGLLSPPAVFELAS